VPRPVIEMAAAPTRAAVVQATPLLVKVPFSALLELSTAVVPDPASYLYQAIGRAVKSCRGSSVSTATDAKTAAAACFRLRPAEFDARRPPP
jgi:hypothetical protein